MKINKYKIKISTIILAFLMGCKKLDTNNTNLTNTLELGFFSDILSLDPSKCRDVISWRLLKQVFEPLLSVNEKGEIIPCLAEKWTLSLDKLTYTFFLKKNVYFHDKTIMNSHDVKASLERTCNPAVNSQVALQYLGDIEGAEEYNAGQTDQIKGITLLDDHKIQIKIKKPITYFLSKLTHCVTGIMGAATRQKTDFLKCEDLIGTGPFKLISRVPTQELSLATHSIYHNGKAKIDGIHIKILSDPEQSLSYFKKGKLDLCDTSFKQVTAIKKDPQLKDKLKELDIPAIAFLAFNINNGHSSNNLFRQAINLAIDRNQIADVLTHTIVPTYTIIPKHVLGYRDFSSKPSFDIKKAQCLLKQSGIKNLHHQPLKIYTISQVPVFSSIAENIAMQLKSNLGLNISIVSLSRGTFLEKQSKGELPMMLYGWTAIFMDPSNFLYDLLYSKSKLNTFNYKNNIVDQLLIKAGEISDPATRTSLYHQAENMILDKAPLIPICFIKRLILVNKRVKGIEYNPIEVKLSNKISLE